MARTKGAKSKTQEQIRAKLKKLPKKMGTPTVYTPELIDELAEDLKAWLKESIDNIFIYDWCEKNDIDPDMPSRWRGTSDNFNRAMTMIEKKQERRCFGGALYKQLDSRMATFALSCKHGWVDKTKLELAGDAENPLKFVFDLEGTKDIVDDEPQPA